MFSLTYQACLGLNFVACLKLVQQIGSEDLVMFFIDAIHQKVIIISLCISTNHFTYSKK